MHETIKPLYYIDSNVFLAVNREEYKKYTRYFFAKLFENQFTGVVSSVTWQEVSTEHPEVMDLPYRYWKKALSYLQIAQINEEVLKLAKTYIDSGIFIPSDFVSAVNVAIASVNHCDAFVSWDYRSIVNHTCQNQLMGINKLLGKVVINLYTPAMV